MIYYAFEYSNSLTAITNVNGSISDSFQFRITTSNSFKLRYAMFGACRWYQAASSGRPFGHLVIQYFNADPPIVAAVVITAAPGGSLLNGLRLDVDEAKPFEGEIYVGGSQNLNIGIELYGIPPGVIINTIQCGFTLGFDGIGANDLITIDPGEMLNGKLFPKKNPTTTVQGGVRK